MCTLLELEDFMLSEISKLQKDKLHRLPLIYLFVGVRIKIIELREIESRMMVTRGWEGWWGWE